MVWPGTGHHLGLTAEAFLARAMGRRGFRASMACPGPAGASVLGVARVSHFAVQLSARLCSGASCQSSGVPGQGAPVCSAWPSLSPASRGTSCRQAGDFKSTALSARADL